MSWLHDIKWTLQTLHPTRPYWKLDMWHDRSKSCVSTVGRWGLVPLHRGRRHQDGNQEGGDKRADLWDCSSRTLGHKCTPWPSRRSEPGSKSVFLLGNTMQLFNNRNNSKVRWVLHLQVPQYTYLQLALLWCLKNHLRVTPLIKTLSSKQVKLR